MKLQHNTHWVAVWAKICQTAHVLWWSLTWDQHTCKLNLGIQCLSFTRYLCCACCEHSHHADMFVMVSEFCALCFSQPQTPWISPKLVCLDLCWWDTPTLHNTPSINTPLSAKAEGRSGDMPLATDDKDCALSTTCHARSSAKPFHISSLEASEGKLWMH